MSNPTPEFISQFIKDQFPAHYLTTGPELVAFTLAYYEWLETQKGSTEAIRSLQKKRDIDTTLDDFILQFKKTFLSGTQLNTQVDDRFMLKHISDIYQSKGTTRSIELLLRLLYNQEVELFLPSERVTYASDSKWKVPTYLELSQSDRTKDFVGKNITGSKSGATGFVESVIHKLVNKKYITVAYMSSVVGDFQTGEHITENGDIYLSPVVVGSLSNITITNGGQNFTEGDTFDIISSVGRGGKAKILTTEDATGRVAFTLANGGYGYTTSNAYTRSLSSNATLIVSNIVNANADIDEFFTFETVEQKLETVTYTSAGSNADLQTYASVNTALVQGANSTGGIVANGYAMSAVAQTFIIQVENGSFTDADVIWVGNTATNGQLDTVTVSTANGELIGQNTSGVGLNANNKPFYSHPKAYIRGVESNTYANVANVGSGVGADFEIGSLGTSEVLTLFTDIVGSNNTATTPKPFANVNVDSSNSGIGFVDSITVDTLVNINGRSNTVTPYAANGGFANGQIVYEANVFVERVSIAAGGSGYTNSDTVAFTGVTANTSAVASIVTWANGAIKDVPITNKGIRYKGQPTVTITTSTGSSADLYAIMGYNTEGATGKISKVNTSVMVIGAITNGSFSSNDTIVNESANAFANASAVASAGGTGYTGSDTITVSGNATATLSVVAGAITAVTVTDPGSQYNANATGTINTSTGSGAFLTVNMDFGLGLPKSGGSDLTTILYNALTFSNFTIGTIGQLNRINPGSGYSFNPFALVHNPYVAGFNRRDLIAIISNRSGTFNPGENLTQQISAAGYLVNHSNTTSNGVTLNANNDTISVGEGVRQLTTNATGIVEVSNATHIKLESTQGAFDDSYVIQTLTSGANVTPLTGGVAQQNTTIIATGEYKGTFSNSNIEFVKIRRLKFGQAFANGSTLVGSSSGATATVENVYDDEDTLPIGLNANVTTQVQTANGIATTLEITDAGYGYEDKAAVELVASNTVFIVAGEASVTKQGVGSGYWDDRRSFTSDINKLHDNDYYQDYSYVTKTGIALEKYQEQLKEILHVSGMKLFGEVMNVKDSKALNLNISNSVIETTNSYSSWMN